MAWEYKDVLTKIAREIEPHAIVLPKSHWIFVPAAWFLFLVSFGKYKREKFYNDVAVAFGPFIGIPEKCDLQSAREIVLHEARHSWQSRWFGLGISPWIGLIPMFTVYVFIIFPVKFAYARFWLELDADKFKWKELLKKKLWTDNDVREDAEVRAKELASLEYYYAVGLTYAITRYANEAEFIITMNKAVSK